MNSFDQICETARKMPAPDAREYLLSVVEQCFNTLSPSSDAFKIFGSEFSQIERSLCWFLYRRVGQIVSTAALYDGIYVGRHGRDLPFPSVINAHICNARKKLPEHIKITTMWGEGFRMELSE